MKTMKWLLRREFWENKGLMLWAPLVAAAIMAVAISSTVIYAASHGKIQHNNFTVELANDGHRSDEGTRFAALPAEKKEQLADSIASIYLAPAVPLLAMMSIIVFFYCLGALHEERRDRSILFWKSLPVSDRDTVLSKVLTAACVTPLITIAIGVFLSVLVALVVGIVAAFKGINMFGAVLSSSYFYLAPFELAGLLPVYIVWALPTIGWLLLVSAWAKSKVFLWAVGVPLLTVATVKWIGFVLGAGVNMDWIVENVISRGLVGLFPGNWLALEHVSKAALLGHRHSLGISEVFTQSWMTLTSPAAIIGAVAGCAMIFAAIRLRRWKDEG